MTSNKIYDSTCGPKSFEFIDPSSENWCHCLLAYENRVNNYYEQATSYKLHLHAISVTLLHHHSNGHLAARLFAVPIHRFLSSMSSKQLTRTKTWDSRQQTFAHLVKSRTGSSAVICIMPILWSKIKCIGRFFKWLLRPLQWALIPKPGFLKKFNGINMFKSIMRVKY